MARWQKGALAALGALALLAALAWAGLAIAERDKGPSPAPAAAPPASDDPGDAAPAEASSPRRAPSPGAPNIVLLLTDDQPASTFGPELMPRTYERLAEQGVRFAEAVAAPPLCCPFRAGLFSGQYVHNNGVLRNRPGYSALRDPELVVPAFLRRAGYRTGFVGKYLNGTSDALGGEPAPGWDRWFQLIERHYRAATVSDDGEVRTLERSERTTDILTRESVEFIERGSAERRPFFLTTAFFAPHPDRQGNHGPCEGKHMANASWADYRRAKRFQMPRLPSYGERDISDKPAWLRDFPPLGERDMAGLEHRWRCSVAAVQPVDRGVERIVEALEREGELGRTWVVFGSDNGYHFGEHRLTGKHGFYEEMLRVPLVVRPPNGSERFSATRGSQRRELVSQVDLAATILALARARTCLPDLGCRRPDGRSLLRLLAGDERRWPPNRGIPLQLGDCRLTGLRTPDHVLIQTSADEDGCRPVFTELYDLRSDPRQLRNLAEERPGLVRELSARLERALRCRGAGPPDGKPGRHRCE